MVTATLVKSLLPDEVPKLESHQHGFSGPIQHFGSALNINIRVQALLPNVVYKPMSGPSVALWSLTVLWPTSDVRLQDGERPKLRQSGPPD